MGFFSDIFDSLGLFHDTSAKQEEMWKYFLNWQDTQRSLRNQEKALAHQIEHDSWSQDFSERNLALQQQQFEYQKNPVSNLMNDAAKNGINPMAAMGVNAGQASMQAVSPAASSVAAPSGAQSSLGHDFLSSMVQSIGSTSAAAISSNTQDKMSRRSSALRQQELSLMEKKEEHDYEISKEKNRIAALDAESNATTAAANKKNADTNRMGLTLDQAKFAFDKQKTIKYYNMDKAMNKFTMKMSQEEFRRRVYEFNEEIKVKKGELSNKIRATSNQKDFQGDYIRMRYILGFSHEISSLGQSFLHMSPSSANLFADDVVENLIGFKP